MAREENDKTKSIGRYKVIGTGQEIDPKTGATITVNVLEPAKPTRKGSLSNGHPHLRVIGQVG